jgi:prepilin peptidase CpaA
MDLSVHTWVIYAVMVAIVTLSAVIDYKHHRIPNWLSFMGWYLGPILYLVFAGLPAASDSLMGLALVLALTFPLFALNWMGAGDVKLMTSVGALVSIDHALFFLASIVFTGFVIGLAQLVLRGLLPSFARRYWAMLGLSVASGRPVYVAPAGSQQTVVMPYAVSVAAGTVAALYLLWM